MLEDFRNTVLRLWPLEDLTDLGVSPTSYLDDDHAFAFLPFGMSSVLPQTQRRRMLNGLILPMLLEDEDLARTLSQNARAKIEKSFTATKMAEETLRLYRRIVMT